MFLLPFAEAEKFLSVTLAKENLSPAVEKERSLLAEKLRKVKTQLGLQSDLPGGSKAPPRPPKGGVPLPVPVTTEEPEAPAEPEELYDDVAGNCSLLIYSLTVYYCKYVFISHSFSTGGLETLILCISLGLYLPYIFELLLNDKISASCICNESK